MKLKNIFLIALPILTLHQNLCYVVPKFEIGSTYGSDELILAGAVTCSAFNNKSGIFVIGSRPNGAAAHSIISITGPCLGQDTQLMKPLVQHATSYPTSIVLSEQQNKTTNVRVIYSLNANDTIYMTTLTSTSAAPSIAVNPIDLLDGNNNGHATIHQLSATPNNIYAALTPAGGSFGETGSSIGQFPITDDTNTIGNGNFSTISKTLDIIKAGTNSNDITITTEKPALHYCAGLERLYIGISATATNNASVHTLLIFDDLLNVVPLLNNDTTTALGTPNLNGVLSEQRSNIVGGTSGNLTTSFKIFNLQTMHTSTDKYYLIVNGGLDGAPDTVYTKRKIFALPLVSPDGYIPGSLAAVTSNGSEPIVDFRNTGSGSKELFTETSPAALVGLAPAPARDINQIFVVGDTVYCSASGEDAPTGGITTTNATGQPAIYYSQALFNNYGAICGWTPWARALPNTTSGFNPEDGSCHGFAIDLKFGRIWTLPVAFNEARVTQWTKSTDTSTIVGAVNAQLNGPCYTIFNLDQYLPYFWTNRKVGMALFGGKNTVTAALTEYVNNQDPVSSLPVRTPFINPASENTITISSGLEDAGSIVSFGWTNQVAGHGRNNFLFAGTNNGLYSLVRADETGLDIGENQLNTTTFPLLPGLYSWKKMNAFGKDSVKKIVSSGFNDADPGPKVFVLTQGAPHTIWSISPNDTITTLTDINATATKIFTAAQISDNSTTTPTFIYDIATIIQSDSIKLVAATNLGLYISPVTNINFTLLDQSNEAKSIRQLVTPMRTHNNNQMIDVVKTIYGKDSNNNIVRLSTLGTIGFPSSSIIQNNITINPSFIIQGDRISRASATFPSTDALITFFASDGAFRIFGKKLLNDASNGSGLFGIPYESANTPDGYNILPPLYALQDPIMQTIKTVNCVCTIGAGHILAGTDQGIIELS